MAVDDDRESLLTDDIRELLRLVGESDIAEVLIKRGDAKVHIKRAIASPPVVNMVAGATSPATMPASAYLPQAVPPAVVVPMPEPASAEAQPIGVPITAPMVGTFYATPTPKDPPYVHVGDEVRPGDVLGIIEAMKIMNEIECEIRGHVREILVENSQPVEYGQPLMIIDPL